MACVDIYKTSSVAESEPPPINGASAGESPEAPRPAQSLAGVPILIVEDDAASARLLLVVLTIEGGVARVAGDAEEALHILNEFPARVIVVDLMLPGMSGLVLVQKLKADPATRHIVAIAVSAVNGPEVAHLAAESGCAAYIRKPIDVQTFATTVSDLLKGTR
jgi:CheY-like chemotaxis protein